MSQLELKHTNVFSRTMDAFNNIDIRFLIEQGGSRSSKTYSILQLLIVYCLTTPNKMVSIIRKTFPTLRGTVMRDFFEIMNELGLYEEKRHHKTENIYNFENGSQVEFFGADNEQKLRGRKRDILYVNESNELNFEEFTQLNMRTTSKLIFDFNPSENFHWLYDLISRKESILIHSTYKDNPFLGESQINEIENLINYDESYYRIYALGEKGSGKTTIYTHWKYYENIIETKNRLYGLDFGFNHPTSLVEVNVDDNDYFCNEKIYRSGMTVSDLIEEMQRLDISKKDEIICDSARPEIIEDLRRNGYNAKEAIKKVKEGIDSVKSCGLFIHKESLNIIKEVSSYKWKTNGDIVLDEPVKLYDDACFVGETLITTDKGLIRIKDIEPGNMVLTSSGYKKVLLKHNNGMKPIKKYRMKTDTFDIYISCTQEHKIKTNLGWIEISKLQSGMIITLHKPSMVKDINYTQVEDTLQNINTICTTRYGSSIMAKDEKDFIYITSTETLGTIELKTLKKSKHLNTYQNIAKIKHKNIEKSFKKQVLKQLKYGTVAKKELNGIRKMLKKYGKIKNIKKNYVKNVEMNMKQDIPVYQNSAIITAKLNLIEEVEKKNREIVYDLTIEDNHQYFANGVLVHNCDAIRYAIHWWKNKTKKANTSSYRIRY